MGFYYTCITINFLLIDKFLYEKKFIIYFYIFCISWVFSSAFEFFFAFWPYILTIIGIYVVFMGRGYYLNRIISLVIIAATTFILQIDIIFSASELYPLSHRFNIDTNTNINNSNTALWYNLYKSFTNLITVMTTAFINPSYYYSFYRLLIMFFPIPLIFFIFIFFDVFYS